MRKYKFRAWAKKTYDHYISDPIEKAYAEFENSEPDSNSAEWDKWYLEREHRVEVISALLNPSADDRYEVTYEMINNFSINGDGKLATPYRYEIIDVMQFTELKDKSKRDIYEGDILEDENAFYVVRFDRKRGSFVFDVYGVSGMMLESGWDETAGEFKKIDTLHFDDLYDTPKVIGNIYENSELINRQNNVFIEKRGG